MATRHLYLVRHGLTDDHEASDELGPGLNAIGAAQAGLVAARLRQLPVTAIHHSPLRRAVQTAAAVSALLPEVPLMVSPLLSECIPGFPTEYAGHFTHLTAERIARDQAQVDAAFRTYVVPAGGPVVHDVIICHGNIIRALMMRVLRVSPERWVHAITHNGGISEVLIDTAGQPFLVSFNETSHLPADLRTH